MSDYVRFIVLCDARTGSNLLIQALNSHPGIRCFREIFDWQADDVDFEIEGYDRGDRAAFELRKRDPRAFLSRYIFTTHGPGIAAVGFKYQYTAGWGFEGLLDDLVADTELRVVHLRRRNTLRWYLSYKIAEATGQFTDDSRHTIRGRLNIQNAVRAVRDPARALRVLRRGRPQGTQPAASKSGLLPMHVSFDECASLMYKARHEQEHLGGLFGEHPTIEVWYEDMESDLAVASGNVERFLGVDPVAPVVTLRKQNPEPLRALIANYDDLKAGFAGTYAEAFFDE